MSTHILVVEDDPIIAADLTDRLEDAGYRVRHTTRGEDCLDLIAAERPELVLMDVNLAGTLDGVDTATRIKDRYGLPLIFLTSNSDGPTFQRARAVRPRAFLTKPFRGRDLLNAVTLALEHEPPPTVSPPPSSPTQSATATDRIFIQHKERQVRLMLADILYATADDYYCRVVTAEQEYLVTKTLKKFAEELPPTLFFRAHRSYLINLRQVTSIGEIYIFLGKHQVPVSRAKREELKLAIRNM